MVCFAGFLFQLTLISQTYFKYQTITRLEVNIGDEDSYVQIYICPRYSDLLDRSEYRKYGIHSFAPLELSDVLDDISNLTIKSIFRLTPPVGKVISKCLVRSGTFHFPDLYDKDSCKELIAISKSITGEHVCYSIMVKGKESYSPSAIAASLSFALYVYEVELSPDLSKTMTMILIMRVVSNAIRRTLYPYNSRIFAGRINNLNTLKHSRLLLYPETTKITRMPPPYDTDCRLNQHSLWCYDLCLSRGLKIVNRVAWSSFIDEEVDTIMLSTRDMNNKTLESIANVTFAKCNEMCRTKSDCQEDFTKTRVTEIHDSNHNLTLISAMVPAGGTLSIISVELLTLIDYLVQVGSSFGIWFGLSIFSTNPLKFKWLHIFKRQKTEDRNVTHETSAADSVSRPKCSCSLCFRRYLFQLIKQDNRVK